MKRKRNIYDADDAAKSKRLHFSPEERAAHAERKAEILGEKLEKAKADLPKKRRARINREFDAMTGKVRHSLSFEDEVKPRSRKNPVARAGLKAGRTVDLAAHSKIRQVEKENVGTEAAHKTEFAVENLAAGAIRKGYRSVKDAPYRKVERLEVKSARATVNANYHAAIRDNPELQNAGGRLHTRGHKRTHWAAGEAPAPEGCTASKEWPGQSAFGHSKPLAGTRAGL